MRHTAQRGGGMCPRGLWGFVTRLPGPFYHRGVADFTTTACETLNWTAAVSWRRGLRVCPGAFTSIPVTYRHMLQRDNANVKQHTVPPAA